MLVIDDMTKEDASGVFLLEEECFTKPWSYQAFLDEVDNKEAVTLVAIDEMEIVGFVNARFLLGEGNINNIAVTKRKRRTGVADALLKTLIERASKKGTVSINLEVRESNLRAISLYKKHGFVEVGNRKNFYEQPRENAILMTLTI